MVNAEGSSRLTDAMSKPIATGRGSDVSNAPKRSPMVCMPSMPMNSRAAHTISVTSTIAVRAPGMRLDILGVSTMMASDTRPTTAVAGSMLPKFLIYTPHLPRKSPGTASSMRRPKKSGIWVENIVTAIPAVKPTTMG